MEDIENESLLKLFAHACQLEQEPRAIDICKLMSSHGLQLAITYASRNKRMQLASKISAIAYEKQEEEEQEKAAAAAISVSGQERPTSPSQASVDLFASQDDDDIDMEPASSNPLLAAEARKESALPKSYTTPTNVSRNPFKKSATPSSASNGTRVSLDDIAKKDLMKNSGRTKTAFGSKKIETATPPSRMLTLGKKKTDKENKSANQPTPVESQNNEGKGLMKGFLLYLEENSQRVSQEENLVDEDKIRDKCLDIWQNLTSDEKKGYKTPRVPKRKRENDDLGTVAKLAKFAAPSVS